VPKTSTSSSQVQLSADEVSRSLALLKRAPVRKRLRYVGTNLGPQIIEWLCLAFLEAPHEGDDLAYLLLRQSTGHPARDRSSSLSFAASVTLRGGVSTPSMTNDRATLRSRLAAQARRTAGRRLARWWAWRCRRLPYIARRTRRQCRRVPAPRQRPEPLACPWMKDPGRRHWQALRVRHRPRPRRLAAKSRAARNCSVVSSPCIFGAISLGNVVDRGSVLDFLHARRRGRVRGLAVTFRTFERLER
jgi:hypothetical protein